MDRLPVAAGGAVRSGTARQTACRASTDMGLRCAAVDASSALSPTAPFQATRSSTWPLLGKIASRDDLRPPPPNPPPFQYPHPSIFGHVTDVVDLEVQFLKATRSDSGNRLLRRDDQRELAPGFTGQAPSPNTRELKLASLGSSSTSSSTAARRPARRGRRAAASPPWKRS